MSRLGVAWSDAAQREWKMKSILLVGAAAVMMFACAGANMAVLGINDDKLKEKVAFDTQCAPAKIQILKKREDQGSGDYVLNACGVEKTYHRTGTVYYADGVDPLASAK